LALVASIGLLWGGSVYAQTLINVDFGVGSKSSKVGFAATGQGTNDFWNLYRHYDPKFIPGMPLVTNGSLTELKLADGASTQVSLVVSNAPGVWGNASGDPMFDTYIFAQNGSNITVTIKNLPPGRYHFYLYGHADPDVSGEQNSGFYLRCGTNAWGPKTAVGTPGWKSHLPWNEGQQYAVFRDVPVGRDASVIVDATPGANGIGVLNGLQILSRGTSPPEPVPIVAEPGGPGITNVIFRSIRYAGKISETTARFTTTVELESLSTNEISAPLFEGEVAVITSSIPDHIRLVNQGPQYRVYVAAPGQYQLALELHAKVIRGDAWNQVSFRGPAAAIASVLAEAEDKGTELQMLSGTSLHPAVPANAGQTTNRSATLEGFVGADRLVHIRWQSKAAEIARQATVAAQTTVQLQITPSVMKYVTELQFEILQAPLPHLMLSLPAAHTLTQLQGEQIRDWQVKTENGQSQLIVEFIKPVEKTYRLTLFSEQPVDFSQPIALSVPQPLEVARETGSWTISAEDVQAELSPAAGLRQINAPKGALAAYRFFQRPIRLSASLKPIQPVLHATDRVHARLEETRLTATHHLVVQVEKAGIYALDLESQAGFIVAEVHGDGVEDWTVKSGRLRINFSNRLLGSRPLTIQMEKTWKEFPPQVQLAPLKLGLAEKVTTQIGMAAAPGLQIKTAELTGLREISIQELANPSDEWLAFASDQAAWQLTLATERLAPRVVAEIFNLITVGEGMVGGSATIRYGILNQGVQEFRIKIPPLWKNVEFTGAQIRRREPSSNTWIIGLQDKVWNAYTLVVTYDFPLDPKSTTLSVGGIHTVDTERESGSIVLTAAPGLQLKPAATLDTLRRIDETEIPASDRALITRPVLLAYQYASRPYQLTVDVNRFDTVAVLAAVADRTQLTTLLTEDGQRLTQALFMVKNHEKQYQRFKLPAGAEFWSCFVNHNATKTERDGDWLLVPLPRQADRDQTFAVEMVYKQTNQTLRSLWPQRIRLEAPQTDVPNTYAEWQLWIPATHRLSGFGGNMQVAAGTTYGLREAWHLFIDFYRSFFLNLDTGFAVLLVVILGLVFLIASALRRGWRGLIPLLGILAILTILAGMLLPALGKAKAKAQRITVDNNLRQVGLAARVFMSDHGRLPASFEEMTAELGSSQVTLDPRTGQRLVYLGAALPGANVPGNKVLAYTPGDDMTDRFVLFADGSVEQIKAQEFEDLGRRGFVKAGGSMTIVSGPTAFVPPAAQPAPSQTVADAQQPVERLAAGGRGAGASASQQGQASQTPLAAGIHPIRIDIPMTGSSFVFTKVLNIGDEPLWIQARVMPLKSLAGVRLVMQLAVFLAGLIWFWRQWLQTDRSTFRLTIALCLMLAATIHMMIQWRILHDGLIIGAPVLIIGIIIAGVVQRWKRPHNHSGSADGTGQGPNGLGPTHSGAGAITSLLLCLTWHLIAQNTNASTPAMDSSAAASKTNPIFSNVVSIVSAEYSGQTYPEVAVFELTLNLVSARSNQWVTLFGPEVALQSFQAQPANVQLLREDGTVAVRLPDAGKTTLTLKLVIKLEGTVSEQRLHFGLPAALASRFVLNINEAEAEVDFPSAVSWQRSQEGNRTRVEAVLGAQSQVDLRWRPKVKRTEEIAAAVFCQSASRVTVGEGVVHVRSLYDYQITQGELRQARLQLPEGHRLLHVQGEGIRSWNQEGPVLRVELQKGVSTTYHLVVETEKTLDALPATVRIDVPQALDVKRASGLIALRATEELGLSCESQELQRVDADEFGRAYGEKVEGIVGAYRFLKPAFNLSARVDPLRPQIEGTVVHYLQLGYTDIRLAARLNYQIKRAGVFSLSCLLPQGHRILAVTGEHVAQWTEKTSDRRRVLEILLKEKVSGSCSIGIDLEQNLTELPQTWQVPGVHPLDVAKLTGFVLVSAEPGLALKTVSFEGLTEVPVQSLQELVQSNPSTNKFKSTPTLAFKYLPTDAPSSNAPPANLPWTLALTVDPMESWVRAEVFHSWRVTEHLIHGKAVVKYEIANAPVQEFRLKIPKAFNNVELNGLNIRRRDQEGETNRVTTQSKVRGNYELTLTWTQPCTIRSNLIEIAALEVLGVERETGALAIAARAPLQVIERKATGLQRIDTQDLPAWARPFDPATVLAYRYVRPGYQLSVVAQRFAEAEVLEALIDHARLTTVIADDGQVMTEMALAVRNNGRQFLELQLPKDTRVWSAFVDSQPVRLNQQGDRLLVPLDKTRTDDGTIPVELVYAGTCRFPKTKGRVELQSPALDVPLKNARWELYLPADYQYAKFGGTMTPASEPAVERAVARFTQTDYAQQEQQRKSKQTSQANSAINNLRSQLAVGNIKDAVNEYNYSKRNARMGAQSDQELRQLEGELRRAQSSNLLKSQSDFFYQNTSQIGNQNFDATQAAKQMLPLQTDQAVAERQWTKLQQIQEIAEIKVQPLRINLPLRGVRHAFSQVLQTEIRKPMTITLTATNTKAPHWGTRILLVLGGFIVLWIVVATLERKPAVSA
jgi:type II secretory pathway pseudopilin PulG